MTDVHLEYLNEVHCRVRCDPGTLMEMSEHFTHYAENYKFHPKYKSRMWDGKISLVNRLSGTIYAGLAQEIKRFCDSRSYSFSFDPEFVYDNVSIHEVKEFVNSLDLPEWLDIRDYQIDAVAKCLRSKRRTLLSPTSSGKSFMIYLIAAWYRKKTLIIVPTIGLVRQMEEDIRSYGFTGSISTSINGLDKSNDIKSDIVITTWQSLDNGKTKMAKAWYQQFKVVFGDEAHGWKAKSLINIMSNMVNTPYRFGTTGTLDNSELNKRTIYGLFGAPYQTVSTREMIDSGYAADIKIKCIVLSYPDHVRKEFHKQVTDKRTGKKRKKSYQEEVDFLVNYEKRTEFIKNLALSLKGNKLVFFRLKDHGDVLYAALSGYPNVYYIDGDISGDRREEIRKAMEQHEEAILLASMGTTSTGVSIKRLHHMIAGSPSKSKIKVLQSIGRMLRQHEEKEHAVLYDIVDDLSYGSRTNFTLDHFAERVKIYDNEKFDYKIYTVGIK